MSETDQDLSGGCACGAIRYKCAGTPLFSFLCQCRQCQHASGGGHSAAFIMDKKTTTISGDVKFWDRTAPNGNTVSQGFCAKCGSPMFNKNSGYPDNRYITAGSLDDPSLFKPQRVIFHEEAQHWDCADPDQL